MSDVTSQSASALVQNLEARRLSQIVERLTHALDRAKYSSGIVSLQQERERIALKLLRRLCQLSRESFSPEVVDKLKTMSASPPQRFELFDPSTLPRDGQYILLKRAALRIWRTDKAIGFVGVNGCKHTYTMEGFKRDLEIHTAAVVEIRTGLGSIDPAANPGELAQAVLDALHERVLRENFLQARRKRGLAEAELVPATRRRVTHCWRCNQSLESKKFWECSACSWIVCKCGACGCQYG